MENTPIYITGYPPVRKEDHLATQEEIRKAFHVAPRVVKEWFDAGAPIFFIGGMYQANYEHLFLWLEQNFRKPCQDVNNR